MYKDPYHVLDADVIIIGAGLSGMTAAYSLLNKEPSLTITILEASDRIGGRIYSKPLLAKHNDFHCFDVGAQWISSQQDEILKLINELDINLESPHEGGKTIVDYDGKIFKQSKQNPFGFCSISAKIEFANFVTKIEKLCQETPLDPQLASLSMQTFIDQNISHKTNKAILELIILTNCGAKPDKITLEFYIFYCISTHGIVNQLTFDKNGLREFWVQGGAQEICNKIEALLENDIEIFKFAKVLKIQQNKLDVEVVSTSGTYYGNNIIIAIPPAAILEIKFWPPLPEPKRQALANSIDGNLSEFVATYTKTFWRENGLSGDVLVLNELPVPNRSLLCCFDITTDKNPALTGYFTKEGGNPRAEILEQLAVYFGNQALHPLHFSYKHWTGSPMCYLKSFKDLRCLRRKTDRIFWAGAETAVEWYGTMTGAIISAHRVASEVIYDIRPASLTVSDMAVFRTNLVGVKEKGKTYNNIFKKLINPYNQASVLLLVLFSLVVWRKIDVNSRLKNMLIKT